MYKRQLQNIGKKDLGIKESAKARTLKTLFKFVQLDPNEITELGTEATGNLTQDQKMCIRDRYHNNRFSSRYYEKEIKIFFFKFVYFILITEVMLMFYFIQFYFAK